MLTNFPLEEREIDALTGETALVTLETYVRFSFVDVFDREVAETQQWTGFLPRGGGPTPFFRVPFTGFHISLLQQQRQQNET